MRCEEPLVQAAAPSGHEKALHLPGHVQLPGNADLPTQALRDCDALRQIAEMCHNDGGPCSNLLTCFVSYSFAGFLQQGLIYWLERPAFPQGTIASGKDILGADGSRILFEVGFMLLMSGVVVAIIT